MLRIGSTRRLVPLAERHANRKTVFASSRISRPRDGGSGTADASVCRVNIADVYPLGHAAVAGIDTLLLCWPVLLIFIWRNRKEFAPRSWWLLTLSFILAVLAYDNLVLYYGSIAQPGATLELLNRGRYLFHYLAVPFLCPLGIEISRRAGAEWAQGAIWYLSWLLAAALAAFDVAQNYIGLTLQPELQLGLWRYIDPQASLPLITIAVTVFMVLVGAGLWLRTRKAWNALLLGSVVGLVGNALPAGTVGPLPGAAAEAVLCFAMLLTEQKTFWKAEEMPGDPNPKQPQP